MIKIKKMNNYDVVYVPQKQISSEKENMELEKLLLEL